MKENKKVTTMEHIIIKEIKHGIFLLTPEQGYVLVNKLDKNTYSEAITKTPKNYYATPIAE